MTLETLGEHLVDSFYDMKFDNAFLGYTIGSVVAVWVGAKIILIFRDSKNEVYKLPFYIYRAIFISANLVAFTLGGLFLYFWSSGYYDENKHHFLHLFTFSFVISLGIWAIVSLSNFARKESFDKGEYLKVPLTVHHSNSIWQRAKIRFNKVKYWVLMPALSGLFLFFMYQKEYNLVSFTLDTSSSMGSGIFGYSSEAPPIEIGKEALRRTISSFDQWTDVVITVFESNDYKSNIQEIISIDRHENASGRDVHFTAEEKSEALSYISSLGDELTSSTPLAETIWSNFLFTQKVVEQSEGKEYKNIVSVIVTDGEGNLGDNLSGFLCENQEFNDFFETSNVNVINLNDSSSDTGFLSLAQGCGYLLWDGYDSHQFNDSFKQIFSNYGSNWFFVYTLGIIYGVYLLIVLSVIPKRI